MRVGRIFREIVSHNASLGQLLLSADAELLTNFHSYLSITTWPYSNLAAHAAIPNLPKFERVASGSCGGIANQISKIVGEFITV